MKIYNEIVIDMNPESSSFEEVIYEDSYEYSGDLMELQDESGNWEGMEDWMDEMLESSAWMMEYQPGGDAIVVDDQQYVWDQNLFGGEGGYQSFEPSGGYWYQKPGEWVAGVWHEGNEVYQEGVTEEDFDWVNQNLETGSTWLGDMTEEEHIQSEADAEAYAATTLEEHMAGGEYGQESLTHEAVMGMTEDQILDYFTEVMYGGTLPTNVSRDDLRGTISEYMPQLGVVPEEEIGFLAEKYGGEGVSFAESLAGGAAGLTRAKDIYGLRGSAREVGQAGGREQLLGLGALGAGFESTQEQYDIAQQQALQSYATGVYGLEQEQEQQWETDFQQMLSNLPGQ